MQCGDVNHRHQLSRTVRAARWEAGCDRRDHLVLQLTTPLIWLDWA
jgi:hypothetical protein